MKNLVQLIGRVGNEPIAKVANNGNKYIQLNLATNENYTNKEGKKIEETTWHNITLWDKKAELAEKYINKGSQIGIMAKLANKSYVTKEGSTVSTYDLRVTEIILLGGKPKTAVGAKVLQANAIKPNATFTNKAEEDLPF
jgi:single-strand DNA-binding protein